MSSVWKTERETLENDHNSSTSIGCFKKKRRNFKGPKTAFDKNQLLLVLPLFSPRSFLFMGNGGGEGEGGGMFFFSQIGRNSSCYLPSRPSWKPVKWRNRPQIQSPSAVRAGPTGYRRNKKERRRRMRKLKATKKK